MKQKFSVQGMTCSACVAHVEKAVKKVDGVTAVNVNLLQNAMTVDFSEPANATLIISAVEKAGYGASIDQIKPQKKDVALVRLICSAVLTLVLMYFSMGHMIGLPEPSFITGTSNAVYLAVLELTLCVPVWVLNRRYFTSGFKKLFGGAPNMDSLVALGSSASAFYGIYVLVTLAVAKHGGDVSTMEKFAHELYFESSATVLTLVSLGKYFEGKSKVKTGEALAKLKNLTPKTAILVQNGAEITVDSASVKAGDLLVVKNGNVLCADGVIEEGSCFVDESTVTGESLPVEKQIGDKVTGGTVVVGGYCKVRVTATGSDSVLSKIIALVEEAGASKAPIARLADKISGVFVPVVMAISLVTFGVWMLVGESFGSALTFACGVLVVSCPCALGLATPVAVMVATGKGAENGILTSNGEALEKLAKVNCVVFDKTGTVTLGKPFVAKINNVCGGDGFLSVVAGVEKASEHPLGKAVVTYAEQNGIEISEPSDFCSLVGRGVTATVDGIKVAVGNKLLMSECGIGEAEFGETLKEFTSLALTPLIVAFDGKFVGIIGVGDKVKPSSATAVKLLDEMGIKTVLLTGDNASSAEVVARQVGISEVFSEVLPSDKQQTIQKLQNDGYFVAMVGDGINDAPALTQADVGIAVASGTDVAVDSADVVLVKSNPLDVATAVRLGQKTVKNIKGNLFWAFFYNAVSIPLAAGVLYGSTGLRLSPMICALAMSFSSVFVVSNALRLRLFKPCENNSNCVGNDSEEQKMTVKLLIEGMMCGMCVKHVENALGGVSGVKSVDVSLENKCAVVTGESLDVNALTNAVTEDGYKVVGVE